MTTAYPEGASVSIVTDPVSLLAVPQLPFTMTARKRVVSTKLEYVYVLLELTMSDQIIPLSVDCCHFSTVPVCPVNVKVPELLVESCMPELT